MTPPPGAGVALLVLWRLHTALSRGEVYERHGQTEKSIMIQAGDLVHEYTMVSAGRKDARFVGLDTGWMAVTDQVD